MMRRSRHLQELRRRLEEVQELSKRAQDGSKSVPRELQEGLKRAQEGSKRVSRDLQEVSRRFQEGVKRPKEVSRGFQELPRGPRRLQEISKSSQEASNRMNMSKTGDSASFGARRTQSDLLNICWHRDSSRDLSIQHDASRCLQQCFQVPPHAQV